MEENKDVQFEEAMIQLLLENYMKIIKKQHYQLALCYGVIGVLCACVLVLLTR